MTNRLDPRRAAALRRRQTRVLARLGDEIIHCIRAEKPLTIWTTTPPTTGYDVDMGVWTPCPSKPFRAYFTDSNNHRLIPVRLQVTDQKIMDSSLKFRPIPGYR